MSIQKDITTKITKLNNTDKDWVIFVNDHVEMIKSSAFEVVVSDADRDRYLYKFDHFLRDNNCDINIVWIAKMINYLNSYDDFTIKSSILIPDQSTIFSLYRLYRTSTTLT
jgi:hypothetical protein